MSRRLHPCLACPGKTRHRAVCGPCRRDGIRVVGDEIFVTLDLDPTPPPRVQVRLVKDIVDIHAPTVAELSAGIDLTRFLTSKETS